MAEIFNSLFHAGLGVSTIIGVICVAGAIVLGFYCPVLKFNATTWDIILIIYIALASVLPVWLLLQPRDYLCSFLLYAMMAGAIIGVFVKHPTMDLVPFAGFKVAGKGTLFPILFVTIACGAISGFHSLISSGTTSKQLAHAVTARALRYFTESGVYCTKEHSGILIFVSYFEKEVRIVADKGISEKISQDLWNLIADELAENFSKGNAKEAFENAVNRCGELLAEYFPNHDENPDELPDGLVILENEKWQ